MSYSSKTILKNTVMLYIRMAVMMAITLYTSRVVLDVLGVDDFGIYSIVGGVVVSMQFISNTLASSLQRFLSYEIGLGENGAPQKIYSMGINIIMLYILISVLILETIGLWFMNNVLTIPEDRLFAANVAYHFSVLTFCANLLRIPYHALIISYEEMSVYAILSISDAILKLFLVFLLQFFTDKLIYYAILVLAVTILTNLSYHLTCRHFFSDACKYKFEHNYLLFKKMFSFSGWNLLGGIAGMAAHEGPSYLMNIFFGVRINAALGIAKQVSSAVNNFTANFQTAFNPQIVKTYAGKETENLMRLIYNSSLLSFYLMVVVAIPLICFSDSVFDLWLIDVPEYAVQFSIILMVQQMILAIGSPLWMVVHATGDIKYYQITLAVINVFILPAVWIVLKLGFTAQWVLYVLLLASIGVFGYRLYYLHRIINFETLLFIKKVIIKGLIVLFLCLLIPYFLSLLDFPQYIEICFLFLSFIYCCLIVIFVGVQREERHVVFCKIRGFLNLKNK